MERIGHKKTARVFRSVRQKAAPVGRQTTMFGIFVEFVTWRHRGRSLLSSTAAISTCYMWPWFVPALM